MDGGTLIAMGISGMDQAPSEGDQTFIAVTTDENIAAGETVTVTDSEGNVVATFEVGSKESNYFVVSTADMVEGETYTLTSGSISADAVAGESPAGGMGGGQMGGGRMNNNSDGNGGSTDSSNSTDNSTDTTDSTNEGTI